MTRAELRELLAAGRALVAAVRRGTPPPPHVEAFLLDRVTRRPVVYKDNRGLRYVLHPGENAGVYLRHGGNYEVAETRFCERVVRPGSTAIDVGAHIGLYTLLLARLAGPSGRVHAFEPEPRNRARLRENAALNGVVTVVVRPEAVYSEPGELELNVFPRALGSWHSLGRPELDDPFAPGSTARPERTVPVIAVTLDGYCAEHGLERVDLLKLDVEGAELDALRGASQLLGEGRVGAVLFEVSLPQTRALGHEPAEVFAELARQGYRSFALTGEGGLGAELGDTETVYGNYAATRDPAALGTP